MRSFQNGKAKVSKVSDKRRVKCNPRRGRCYALPLLASGAVSLLASKIA